MFVKIPIGLVFLTHMFRLHVWTSKKFPVFPEGMSQLGICGMYHLLAVSLSWSGIFHVIADVWWLWVLVWLGIVQHFGKN